jgi:hypothetical protein
MLLFLNTVLLFAWVRPADRAVAEADECFPCAKSSGPLRADDDDGTRVVRVDVDAHM